MGIKVHKTWEKSRNRGERLPERLEDLKTI